MFVSLLIKWLLIEVFFDSALSGAGSLNLRYPKFDPENQTDLILHNSYIVLNAIQVTPDVSGGPITNLSGRAFHKQQFKLWGNSKGKVIRATFNSTFVLHISPRTTPGGEGLAFVLSADSDLPENSQGEWLGIVNADTNGTSRARIVAVEFDTRQSSSGDADSNHVGLDVNSIWSVRQVPLAGLGVDLSSDVDVTVLVRYDGKNLTVFVGKENERLVFSEPIDLSAYLPEKVFVGFSASTSNYTELNCVKSWEFNGSDIDGGPRLWWIKIAIPAGVAIVICITFYCRWKSRRDAANQAENVYPSIEEEIKGSSMAPKQLRLKDLMEATGKFSSQNLLGKGGFGEVYKGVLKNREVAVKKLLKERSQGKQEFMAEIATIGNLNHKNLVKLIGWCCENREFLLVYEYMPNGSLDKFIFRDENSSGIAELILNWDTRLNVISGVAQALDYLHNGCEERVLHRDIKASNVLLDLDFNAKLGDFGLARAVRQSQQTHHSTEELAGTAGYMAPESFHTRRVSMETDVYAFGVLILEVVCGKKPGIQMEQSDYSSRIVHWVWELHRIGRLLDAGDQKLHGEFAKEEMECVLVLGLACCHPNPHQRPSIKTVLQVLAGEADPPLVAAEMPAFVWPPALPPSFRESDCTLIGSQLTPFSEISGR